MSTIPYLYVNIAALCCYALLFVAFIAAKKTPEIKAFLLVIIDAIFWTGGSVLMRLQAFPGMEFWYYVSLVAIFAFMPLLYLFVCSFAKVKGFFLKFVWLAGTAIILILTPFGIFLAPPTPTFLEGVGTVYLYDMTWTIAIPYAFFLGIVVSLARIFLKLIREKGIHTPGLQSIILGCLCLAVGNIIQIFPNNAFPYDTLSGVCFALLVMVALVKKRMFRMTLLISRNVLLLIATAVFSIAFINFINPLEQTLETYLSLKDSQITIAMVLLFAVLLFFIFLLVRSLIDALFAREEKQNKLLKAFSMEITQSLNINEIMDKLVRVIKDEVVIDQVYICLREKDSFVAKHSFNPLVPTSFSIKADSPCVTYLLEEEPYFLLSEFRNSPKYLSMWDTEKLLFRSLDISCVVALKNDKEISGLVLLAGREKQGSFSYLELSFVTTLCSVASVAIKNARLYEKMYREARIDNLTGVYNYRFFMEELPKTFAKCKNDSLALVYLDLDDFKLYNQLYGGQEGDQALCRIANLLLRCVGEQGKVFRTSGKIFAVLLPHYDGRQAYILTQDIKQRIAMINNTPTRANIRPLTVSCGICVSPYSAASAKELSENADLAVYHAKNAGKDKIIMFQKNISTPQSIAERAMRIIEQTNNTNQNSENSRYSSALFALTAAIDAKDHYTCRHSLNVARYAAVLAAAIGLSDEQVRIIYEAGLLHDIGKISVPESILNKETRLTEEEITIMQGHVNNCIEIIRHLPAMDYLIPAAVGHHERWDGQGYPRGLAGEDIPIAARCLALADAFDAMTSDRPYRKGLSLEYALKQIKESKGKQFDPELCDIFIRLVKNHQLDENVLENNFRAGAYGA